MEISTNEQGCAVKDFSLNLLEQQVSTLQTLMLVIGKNGMGGNIHACSDFIQGVEELRGSVQTSWQDSLRPLALEVLQDAEKLYPGIQRRMLGRSFHEGN